MLKLMVCKHSMQATVVPLKQEVDGREAVARRSIQ